VRVELKADGKYKVSELCNCGGEMTATVIFYEELERARRGILKWKCEQCGKESLEMSGWEVGQRQVTYKGRRYYPLTSVGGYILPCVGCGRLTLEATRTIPLGERGLLVFCKRCWEERT